MVINEQVRGVLRYSVGENHEPRTLEFDESHIVRNSCSISATCCDSGKFTIGEARPSKLTIKLHIPSDQITRYSLFGSSLDIKIKYDDGDWIYMGRFYTTSVPSGRDNVYAITAYDSLILFSPGAYDSQMYGTGNERTTEDYTPAKENKFWMIDQLKSFYTDLGRKMQIVVENINSILENLDADRILYVPDDDICNNALPDAHRGAGWVLYYGTNNYQKTSHLDFVRSIAEMAAGCAQMMEAEAPENAGRPQLYITPYGYKRYTNLLIPYTTQEMNSVEIADYTVYIQNVYVKTYDGTGWAAFGGYRKHDGNVVIDVSGNPFADGAHYHDTSAKLPFNIICGIGEQLGSCQIRPFTLKAHLTPQNRSELPHLGRRVEIELADKSKKESIITAWSWTLHGGWKLSCGGEDSRTLSQGIVKSRAYHAETAAMMYTDAKTAGVSGAKDTAEAAKATAEKAESDAANAWSYADSAWDYANSAMGQAYENFAALQDLTDRVSALEGR